MFVLNTKYAIEKIKLMKKKKHFCIEIKIIILKYLRLQIVPFNRNTQSVCDALENKKKHDSFFLFNPNTSQKNERHHMELHDFPRCERLFIKGDNEFFV